MSDESSLIVQMLRSLDSSLAALRSEITANYMPRPEIESRFGESTRDRHDLSLRVQMLTDRLDTASRQRIIDRRWVITTALGVVTVVVAVLAVFFH